MAAVMSAITCGSSAVSRVAQQSLNRDVITNRLYTVNVALLPRDWRCCSRVVSMATHGPAGVEPDLTEEVLEYWGMPGEELEASGEFKYGKADGHHSFHDGDEGTFLENWNAALEAAGGPTGSQKWISLLFLPNFFIMVAYGVKPEYYVIYTVLFLFAFIGLEMAKPEKPTNFEPEMYQDK